MAKQPTARGRGRRPRPGSARAGRPATTSSRTGSRPITKRWSYGSRWVRIRDYAKEGDYSVYGVEPDYATSSSLTLATSFSVPRTVQSYLRFAHQYRLDSGIIFDKLDLPIGLGPYYDGARLEYQVDGRGLESRRPACPGRSAPARRSRRRAAGSYTAFGGDSHGYVASRVDLTSLAGKIVKFRWKLFGDKQIAFDGWTIDDVKLFACGGKKPSNVPTMTVTAGSKKVTVELEGAAVHRRRHHGLHGRPQRRLVRQGLEDLPVVHVQGPEEGQEVHLHDRPEGQGRLRPDLHPDGHVEEVALGNKRRASRVEPTRLKRFDGRPPSPQT